MDDKMAGGYRTGVSGTVSALDTTTKTFILTHRAQRYTVQYAGVSDQRGIDALLARAQADGLATKVRCQSLNAATTPPTCITQTSGTMPRKAITVKAAGAVSELNMTAHTFTLGYPVNKTLPVDYHQAFLDNDVEGLLADGVQAEASLFGFATGRFLAREVEVEN